MSHHVYLIYLFPKRPSTPWQSVIKQPEGNTWGIGRRNDMDLSTRRGAEFARLGGRNPHPSAAGLHWRRQFRPHKRPHGNADFEVPENNPDIKTPRNLACGYHPHMDIGEAFQVQKTRDLGFDWVPHLQIQT